MNLQELRKVVLSDEKAATRRIASQIPEVKMLGRLAFTRPDYCATKNHSFDDTN